MPTELEKADSNLIQLGYDALQEEKYQLAKTIFDFAIQILKKHSSTEKRYIMIVNRALAYKWSGDDKKAKEIISQEDWSAASTKFKLSRAVILDNYDDAYELMNSLRNDEEFSKDFYRVWPLFKAIKEEPKFQEVFQEIYGELYNKVELNSIDLPDNLSPEDHPQTD